LRLTVARVIGLAPSTSFSVAASGPAGSIATGAAPNGGGAGARF